jgi:hypothetical protein
VNDPALQDDPAEFWSRSPELFPFGFDIPSDTFACLRLSRADFEEASFLDARILTPGRRPRSLPWRDLSARIEAAGLTERCDFIFHIGHVGSTLLSRLLGAHPGVFSLREPLVLRGFAQLDVDAGLLPTASLWSAGDREARLAGCLKLLSRTFNPGERAVVKATSFVSELAARLLSRPAAPQAILMFVSAESYLATIFAGPNSRQEAKLLAPMRLRRLQRRLGREAWRLESLREGQTVALAWACEMSALAQAASVAGTRVMRLDFDEFLADPPRFLHAALGHFQIDAGTAHVDAILRGPHLHRYSKAPEHAYDAALRRRVLSEARAEHRVEIKRGLDWLERAAADFPALGAALSFAAPNQLSR